MVFGKDLQAMAEAIQDMEIAGPLHYMGTWDATNPPAGGAPVLADGTGNKGDLYVVSVGGTQNLGSGAIDFSVGDWVVYNGTIWQKADHSDVVTSVFGRQAAVVAQAGDYTHAQIGAVGADDHHAQSHAHNGVDGSGTVAHSDTTGQTADDHHAQLHAASHAAGGADEVLSIPKWEKYTVGFAALAAAALTNDIELLSLPAGGVIHAVKIKHSASFVGGAIGAYTISVGIVGTLAKYLAAFNVFQAPGNAVQTVEANVGTENHAAVTSIRVAATAVGANLDQATAGSVDIWVLKSVAV
jgi:hypothetical protein